MRNLGCRNRDLRQNYYMRNIFVIYSECIRIIYGNAFRLYTESTQNPYYSYLDSIQFVSVVYIRYVFRHAFRLFSEMHSDYIRNQFRTYTIHIRIIFNLYPLHIRMHLPCNLIMRKADYKILNLRQNRIWITFSICAKSTIERKICAKVEE